MMEKTPGARGGDFAETGEKCIRVFVLERDARGNAAVGMEGLKRVGKGIVPTEGRQSHWRKNRRPETGNRNCRPKTDERSG